jgi:parvulin-like peptidyl-prolyl isomerase
LITTDQRGKAAKKIFRMIPVFKPKKYSLNLAFPLLLLLFAGCEDKRTLPENVLARVGTIDITVEDFWRSYELYPVFNPANVTSIEDRKNRQLQALVDNAVLTQEALKKGYEKNPRVQAMVKAYERKALLAALFRVRIKDQISIPDSAVRASYVQSQTRLFLRKISFPDSLSAALAAERLKAGESFTKLVSEIASDPAEYAAMMQPREFNWGQLDEKLEAYAYKMAFAEVSPPIAAGNAYHIMQLTDRREKLIITESEYQKRENYVRTILRRRRSKKLADAYATAMMEQFRPRVDGRLLQQVAALGRKNSAEFNGQLPPFMQSQIIRQHLGALAKEPLLFFNGGRWSVEDFLDHFDSLLPSDQFDLFSPGPLPYHLSVLFRDEQLVAEARSEGMGKDADVMQEVVNNKHKVLALFMRRTLVDTVGVSETEISALQETKWPAGKMPVQYSVSEILLANRHLADSLKTVLLSGADFAKMAGLYTERPGFAFRNGLLGWLGPRFFPIYIPAVENLKIGDLSEVIPVSNNTYAILRLEDKRIVPPPSPDQQRRLAQNELLGNKQQQILANYLINARKNYEIERDPVRLENVLTTDMNRPANAMNFILKEY